jgi:hypothetical protein
MSAHEGQQGNVDHKQTLVGSIAFAKLARLGAK